MCRNQRLLLLFAFASFLFMGPLCAQSDSISEITFSYDQAGNRTERAITYVVYQQKSASVTTIDREEDEELLKGLLVYPNPAQHSVFIKLNQQVLEEEKRFLMLYDNLGKELLFLENLEELNRIDLSRYPTGTYIIKLVFGHKHSEWIVIKN